MIKLNLERRDATIICVLVSIALIATYSVILDKSQFTSQSYASLNFSLTNGSNKFLNVSFYLYVYYLNFNGTITTPVHGNFTVWTISDGSGIEVDCNDLTPSGSLSLKINRLKILPSLPSVEDALLRVSFSGANASDFSYNGLVSFLNNQGISVASQYTQTSGRYLITQEKTTTLYLNMLIAALAIFFIGTIAMIFWQRAKWFPFITSSILVLTLFLYVFIGSAPEIEAKNWTLPLLSLFVFIHGFDWHIFGNLAYFLPLSVLFESFLRMKGQWMKRDMLLWYFVPLYLPSTALLVTPWGGFGLSLAIEVMTWTLWAYIISNYKELIISKFRMFLAILAGIPSFVFLGWVVNYSFGSYGSPYDVSEALLHIVFGVVSCVIVLLLASRREIVKLKSAMSRIGRSRKESSKTAPLLQLSDPQSQAKDGTKEGEMNSNRIFKLNGER